MDTEVREIDAILKNPRENSFSPFPKVTLCHFHPRPQIYIKYTSYNKLQPADYFMFYNFRIYFILFPNTTL